MSGEYLFDRAGNERGFWIALFFMVVFFWFLFANKSVLILIDGSEMIVLGLTRDVYAYYGWFGVSVPSAFVVEVR